MPKIVNYPRSSFQRALDIAEAADSLGGSCDIETCANKLDLKVGGSFRSAIAAAQKFDLIHYEKGQITLTEKFKVIKLSYSEEEKRKKTIECFLQPEVFNDLYNRFVGKELPINILENLLIREYDVEENVASRVSKYFTDGLRELELIDSNNVLKEFDEKKREDQKPKNKDQHQVEKSETVSTEKNNTDEIITDQDSTKPYTVHIYGPGINSKINIRDEDDLVIVNAFLNKIKRYLGE